MYLTQYLHTAMRQDPERPFTVLGQRVRTVAESADRVRRLAGALRELGATTGDRVAMIGLNSDRYVEYLLAVPWADAVLVPLNNRWSVAEMAFAIDEAEIRLLLVDDAFAEAGSQLRRRCPGLEAVVFCGDGECPEGMLDYERLIAGSEPAEDAQRGGGELLGVFYTGGTTGTPKGVMLSHDSVLMNAIGSLATGDLVSTSGRMLHVAPMFHLAGIFVWLTGTIRGATHVLLPRFTPEGVLEALEEEAITDVLLVPTMMRMMVDHPDSGARDLSRVRHILYGTSPIAESLLSRVRALFANAKFAQAYGMTELAPVATVLRPADHDHPELRRSAGRAAPHAEVRVVDEEDREVPCGTMGEIVVRGDHMMLGYWKREHDTAAALRGGWMHTGDAGYMDERGYFYVVDRLKDMIVSGGENVYSAEVENALLKHSSVAACAVIGVPDDRWGERVHAVVVPHPGHEPGTEELRAFCAERIAAYKSPRSSELVDELPIAATGKILKRELRKAHWASDGRQVH
ncbi:acyl-CoA synthetase (AMP-forming)/AMP-acid ligase II [Lipingzhangella halophila]|uniref:Acyl-CoA synthetase (AMP-forming)/AMP-acid ligase II n=1 Tax=Lipingzhangella halophila TaxID=1783352 RepID=A0A7W7RGI5_9ACTN|nr:long-chain-fatty-acid--CoA ligase [Lipingzhangella halophila]MBB4931477.1 acyl-CoA synthetase (AMP-forming)/AMP-acid ligase II [Lipingzhangella halophila]